MAEGGKQPGADGPTPQEISWGRVVAAIGAASSVVGLLAFFGINNFTQLKHMLSSASTSSATASSSVNVSYSYSPAASSPADATSAPAAPTTYMPVVPSTPAFDPRTLDDKQTDRTLFTAAALLPQGFTDSRGIHYSLAGAGPASCGDTGSMSSNFRSVLNSNGCTSAMTGDYLGDGGTANSEVLVSVQIFPFDTASTALRVREGLTASAPGDYGIYCTLSGLGHNPCDNVSAYPGARKIQYIGQDHRYLIVAVALYTNMTQDSAAEPAITSAAWKAVYACGPGNLAGNQ